MREFIWTILILMVLETMGKAIMIWKQDFQRSPGMMVGDIVIALGFVTWAAWLLGRGT